MAIEHRHRFKQFLRRSVVGYFAPVVSACRLRKKPGWDYARQLRVVYRYTFGR